MVDFARANVDQLNDPITSLNRILSLPLEAFPELGVDWAALVIQTREFICNPDHKISVESPDIPTLLDDCFGTFRLLQMAVLGRAASYNPKVLAASTSLEKRFRKRGTEKLHALEEFLSSALLNLGLEEAPWLRSFDELVANIRGFHCRVLDLIDAKNSIGLS